MEPYFHLKGSYKTSADATVARAEIENSSKNQKRLFFKKAYRLKGRKDIKLGTARKQYILDIESDGTCALTMHS